MKQKPPPTYDSEALGVLAFEFPFSKPAEAEAKIKRRLQRKKLGRYDPERIARLRRLKNDLQHEIGLEKKSSYYQKSPSRFADIKDFDIPRLTRKMIRRYPKIPRSEIESFVPYCVAMYHLL